MIILLNLYHHFKEINLRLGNSHVKEATKNNFYTEAFLLNIDFLLSSF